MKNVFTNLIYIVLLLISYTNYAQCSMCKTVAKSGNWSSGGLNTGILYLMIIPYIAAAIIAYSWYKSSRKNKIKNQL